MYRAAKSFSGIVDGKIFSMKTGEVKAITDKQVVADLTRARYIEEVKEVKAAKKAKKGEQKNGKNYNR